MLKYSIIAALAGTLVVGGVSANPTAQDTVNARKARFREMGAAFKALSDQARRPSFDMPAAQGAGARLLGHATSLARTNWFPTGTGPSATVKTAASPQVWSAPAEFNRWRQLTLQRSVALSNALRAGDTGAAKLAMRDLGGACAGCHHAYRVED